MTADPGFLAACRRQSGSIAVAGAACLVAVLSSQAHANSTAGASVKEAAAAGQKWQPDAVLTHVSTLVATPDGKARSWLYTFYSPKARKSAIVTARGGKVEIEPDVRNTSTEPIGAEFLDSDRAIEAARRHGLKIEGSTGMGLTQAGQATGKSMLFWSVMVMREDGFSAVTLDGRNGALIKRDDTKFK